MDVNIYYTEVYENILCIRSQGKQTQTNPISNPTTVFLRKSAWGRLTAESLGLLITQEIATAIRSDDGLVEAVRSRKISDIRTDILEGHLSTALCHMGNISYRIGAESSNEQIKEVIQGDKDLLEAFERFQGHLAANGVNLKQTPAILGPWLKMNSRKERFFGKFSKRANKLLTRDYRKPFVVSRQV